MFAHSYSEDSHERASVNNMLQCIVQSSAGDKMTWQRVCRCVVVQVAHFTLTAQRQQSCIDHNRLSSSVEYKNWIQKLLYYSFFYDTT